MGKTNHNIKGDDSMIENYIKKVTFYLPFRKRKDIALELETMIFDMCHDDFSDANIQKVLQELGNPSDLALQYSNHQYLIGPDSFPRYKELLILVLCITLPILLLFHGIKVQQLMSHNEGLNNLYTTSALVVMGLFELIKSAFIIFAIITAFFAVSQFMNKPLDFEIEYTSTPVKNREGMILFEGILTIVGTLVLAFIVSDLDGLLSLISIDGLTILNRDFYAFIYFAIIPVLIISGIGGLLKIKERKETRSVIAFDMMRYVSVLLVALKTLSFAYIVNPEYKLLFWDRYLKPLGTPTATVFEWFLNNAIIIIAALSLLELVRSIYKFYKSSQTHKIPRL